MYKHQIGYNYTKEEPTVLAEYATDGTIIKYTYGTGNERITAAIKNSLSPDFITPQTYTMESDIYGNVRKAVDSDGMKAAGAEYSVWGEILSETGIRLSENVGSVMIATSYGGYTYDMSL